MALATHTDQAQTSPDPLAERVRAHCPTALRGLRQWVAWRRLVRDGKATKIPVNPHTGGNAQSTNPATWGTLEEALACYKRRGLAGVGIVATEGDGLCGVDFDHCIDAATGTVDPAAMQRVEALDSYAERSPSGTGIHVYAFAKLPEGRRKMGTVEFYDEVRFFTFTGDHIENTPVNIEPRQEPIERLHAEVTAEYEADRQAKRAANAPQAPLPTGLNDGPSPALSDQEVQAKAAAARNGAKFLQLWGGDTSGYPSHSEADAALCSLLAFWTQDAAQIDRLFRASGLFRPKWDTRRGASTYGADTIASALAECSEHYTPGGNGAGIAPPTANPTQDAPASQSPTFEVEHLTDLGNAKRLVRLYGRGMRYVLQWGWLVWDSKRWARDETGQVMRWAKRTALSLYDDAARLTAEAEQAITDARDAAAAGDDALSEAANEKAKGLMKRARAVASWAEQSQQRARISGMIELAASELPVVARVADFDTDPWALNVDNGTVDLRTGQLRPHRREDLITKLCPVAYDPSATAPLWDTFLAQISGTDADPGARDELIAYKRRVYGYALTADVGEQAFFMLWGTGANGKSTELNAIHGVLGDDYAWHVPTETLLHKQNGGGIPNDVARLRGMRFVTAIEADAGRHLAEGLVKQLTGGDPITARFMRAEFFTFFPTHKLFLATNHKPTIWGSDHAIWRRIKLIPYTVTIPEADRDKDLLAKLLEEAPGILAWLVKGCLLWQRDGLQQPKAVTAATAHYKDEQDIIGEFLSDCCVLQDGAQVTKPDLYAAYLSWCEEAKEKPLTKRTFGSKLQERGIEDTRTNRARIWVGIGLQVTPQQATLADPEPDPDPGPPSNGSGPAPSGDTSDTSDGKSLYPANLGFSIEKSGEKEFPSDASLCHQNDAPAGAPGGNGDGQTVELWAEGPKRMSPDEALVGEYMAAGDSREEAIRKALIEQGRREIRGGPTPAGNGHTAPTLEERVLEALGALGQAGFSSVSVRLKEPPGPVRAALERLRAAGKVRAVRGGNYALAEEEAPR